MPKINNFRGPDPQPEPVKVKFGVFHAKFCIHRYIMLPMWGEKQQICPNFEILTAPIPTPLDRSGYISQERVNYGMFFHSQFHFHQCLHLDASAGRETINVTTFKIYGDPICTMLKFRLDRCTGARNHNHKFERNLIFWGLPYPQPQPSVKNLAMQKRTEPAAPNFTLITAYSVGRDREPPNFTAF